MTRAISRLRQGALSRDLLDPIAAPFDGPIDVAGASLVTSAPGWTRRYVAVLVAFDAISAIVGTGAGWGLRFGNPSDTQFPIYITLSAVITLGWLACMNGVGAYDLRLIATATQDVRRAIRAALILVGAASTVAYLSHVLVARTFIAIAIPVGALLQVLARYMVRRVVYARRAAGEWTLTIVAVGTSESVRHLVDATVRNPFAGLRVIGACMQDAEIDSEVAPGVPVLGDVTHAAAAAASVDADIVAVAGAGLGPTSIRELGWALEGTRRKMVMAPGLTEVAGPRVHVSPVDGLPLVWVDQPQFTGVKRLAKRGMDIVGSLFLILVASPLLFSIAALVRLTSSGPALYRSVRVSSGGTPMIVYKFRSMFVDAEHRRAELLVANEAAGGVLFKIRADPRVTPVGRLLRKFSLDELPQLLNVVNGSMSLVGPRPPLPDEVEKYTTHAHRRLLVKPGMTGLWQVSGRSDLSWEESVRLDLFYVENWSLGLDLAIVLRTVWAVLRGRGAY